MKTTFCLLIALSSVVIHAAETVWLDTLDLTKTRQSYGRPQVNRSMREKPLAIAGKTFERGVGTHANSTLWIDVGPQAERFLAQVGVDDAAGEKASVVFRVWVDGVKQFDSGLLKTGAGPRTVDVALAGAKVVLLQVTDGGDGIGFDHGDWAAAQFRMQSGRPVLIDNPELQEAPVLLTPPPAPHPRINAPRIHGCRSGHPFLFRIPTQGERPMEFSATGLPAGVNLDSSGGILSGTAPAAGTHRVRVTVKNRHGSDTRELRIVAGETLALTPPMGWNHWYAHYDRVSDAMLRDAAERLVRTGLADVGYQYVSIDDCWMNAPKHSDPRRVGPLRDSAGRLIPNSYFPDMPAMTAAIHQLGLKAGIYTSPGPLTCAGFAGSHQNEAIDARTFAEWGFDFLKYDWCSYEGVSKQPGLAELDRLQKPYRQMGRLLREQPRDIVFNLCQYGMGRVWEWGEAVGGHCWRTAGDLGFELDRIFEVALANAAHREFSRPGAWNDPDYLQIGHIGDARGMGTPKPCPLTPSEQYAYVSLWCLMAAPLFYSGDMPTLDAFTLNVLGNPEVIEIDQDPLGQSARWIPLGESTFALVKDLEDGAHAVGLFNSGEFATDLTVTWKTLGLAGAQNVRDVWRQQEVGSRTEEFRSRLARRGGRLLRLVDAQSK